MAIDIPEKRYFTISEVAKLCDVKPHVLRYWEQEFPKLKPNKRSGNRRYYLRSDVILIQRIKTLLYEQGFTIAGARKQLKQDNVSPTDLALHVKAKLEEILAVLA